MNDFAWIDWQIVRVDDPQLVPGDPHRVALLGKKLKDTADLIKQQATKLHNLVDGKGWDSEAGRAFRARVGDTVKLLNQSYDRYHAAGTALGHKVGKAHPDPKKTDWASALAHAQKMAKDAITKGKNADHESSGYQKQIDKLPDDHDDHTESRLKNKKKTADGELGDAEKALQAALNYRDKAAGAAASAIRDVINHDGLKDKKHRWWETPLKWVATVGHWAGVAAAALGVASLLLGWVPVLGEILGALALLTSVVALVCDTISAAFGEGTWLDVAIDTLGVMSFGAGRLFGAAAKEAASTARASDESAIAVAKAGQRAWKPGDPPLLSEEARATLNNIPDKFLDFSFKNILNVTKESVDPKVYAREIRESFASWKGLSGVHPSEILPGGTLRGVRPTEFKSTAKLARRQYFLSQGIPLFAGWGNLAPDGRGDNWLTSPDLSRYRVSGRSFRSIPGMNMHGTPFINWRWGK